MKTALVTGGAGFVGTNLCLELKKRGYHVKCLDNNYKDRLPFMEKSDIEIHHKDVLDGWLQIYKAAKDSDVVIHLAVMCLPLTFKYPQQSMMVAVHGTYNVLKAAHKAGAFFVYVSSSEVYGSYTTPMSEALPLKPSTLYGAGKAAGELVTEAYAKLHNLRDKYLIVRPFNCYGPYAREDKYATVITNFLKALIHGGQVNVYGDGLQTRDFMHVSDTVDGLIVAYEGREKLTLHPIVNLCTGKETSLNKLWDLCVDVVESELDSPAKSYLRAFGRVRQGDIRRMWGSPWYAEHMLGWKYKIDLEEGLRDYVKWLVEKDGR